MQNKKILICYNEPVTFYSNYLGKDFENKNEITDLSETEFIKNLNLLQVSLLKNYTSVEFLGLNKDIQTALRKIKKHNPDVIFNFVESIEGDTNFESFIPGLFDIMDIQYTGNNSMCLGNCLHKIRTKQLLDFNEVKTPAYQVIDVKDKIEEEFIKLKYPIIMKIVTEDASIGISENSVVYDFAALKRQSNFLFRNYKKSVVLEEYINGRELNVSILGGNVLPISEISFSGLPKLLPKIVTYEAKWAPGSVYFANTNPICPAQLNDKLANKVKETALKAYHALSCRDYARVDIRLDKNNLPYVIEINPNPDISPDTGFVRSSKAAGIDYNELLHKLAQFALKRAENDSKNNN
ncbi:MAG: ATP-grasp domain-containing protein [Bacteroidetes bacterium]|nr:ATP-grasp domain-containing protein [Bacteroidota bacterium]